ncbi:hypothetical protein [Cloacibacillus sp. An23]|uniref:hypothetical protein n=1 Tax=Cloacibacillus sp. An23 TaxID=1965591 RepID=UPI000B36DE93|nr:hypothetical protein [Cloacibacillus sp. An23]OUO90110.1 hypothetical protein B5F39_13875 [Cloacibacillus sp. An23]
MSESTGTITVTNGSANVTGSGTLFATNFCGPDDLLIVDGLNYVIKSVTSDTALTLTRPYTGTTASGKTYEIIRTTGEKALNELAHQVAELVNKYGTTVNSITDTPGASKIPKAGDDGKLADSWISDAAFLKTLLAFDNETNDTLTSGTGEGDVVLKGANGILEILARLSSGLSSKGKVPMLDSSGKVLAAQLPAAALQELKLYVNGESDETIIAATKEGDIVIRKVSVE